MELLKPFVRLCSTEILLTLIVCNFFQVLAQDFFICPQMNGFYPDPIQCDLYYHCYNGEVEEKLCSDGLVFDDTNYKYERCDIPVNVDCGERKRLQEPKGSKECPRANGLYRHWDSRVCDKFVNCVDGKANELPCPAGLIYDDSKSNCVWPSDNLRKDCNDTKRVVLEDGFSCPVGVVIGPTGRVLPHPTFPHPEDCQKFYICRNGVLPQYGRCSADLVYNDATFRCDRPKNVPGCESWLEEEDTKGTTKKP